MKTKSFSIMAAHFFHYLVFLTLAVPFPSSYSSSSRPHGLTKGLSLSVENKDDSLVSPNRLFTAGFYEVGGNAYCFTIWFSEETEPKGRTVVWMANRDAPVNGKDSKLSLWEDGNLVLTDAGEYIIWSTQTKSTSLSVQLQLYGTGNLVLLDGGGQVLWQSFDYPTDTLLPDQLFTGNTELVSSTSSTNFSSGFYKLFFDSDSILRLRFDGRETTTTYWPDPGLSAWEAGRSQYIYKRMARLNPEGKFNTSDRLSFSAADYGSDSWRIMKIDVDGNLRLYSLIEHERRLKWEVQWEAVSHPCKIHGICGPNSLCTYSQYSGRRCTCLHGHKMRNSEDWSYGCEPEFSTCEEGGGDDYDFIELRFVEFYGYDIRYNVNFTLDDCKNDCLQESNCKGFQFGYDDDEGYYYCYMKTSLSNGYEMGFYNSMYVKLPKTFVSSFHQNRVKESNFSCPGPVMRSIMKSYEKKHDNRPLRYILGLACVIGLIEILCIAFFLYSNCERAATTERNYVPTMTGFRKFTYLELKKASCNFSEEIGRGGAGVVYKGALSENRQAAIKRLKETSHHGEAEFQAEISTIGRLNHMNLLDTWGYCIEGKHRLVVYEYMENGSLAENLRLGNLDWQMRFEIARGIAKGLAYLHEECLEWVLHCDVKPHNILLDANYNPKVADFGLSKLFNRGCIDKTNFSMMRGTRGYMAPEWLFNLPITSKVDVYSYGVVILEMVTGRSPSGMQQTSNTDIGIGESLVDWVSQRIREHDGSESEKWIEKILDPLVTGEYDEHTMINLVKVALHCVEEDRHARPSMSQVVNMLLHPQKD